MKIQFGMALMLAVQVFLWWAQMSVGAIAADAGVTGPQFYGYNNTTISSFDAGGYVLTNNTDVLPNGEASVSPTTGNIFTDTFSAVRSWFQSASSTVTTGVKLFTGFLFAVPNAVKATGAPAPITFGIGVIWYGMAVFMLVMLLMRGS